MTRETLEVSMIRQKDTKKRKLWAHSSGQIMTSRDMDTLRDMTNVALFLCCLFAHMCMLCDMIIVALLVCCFLSIAGLIYCQGHNAFIYFTRVALWCFRLIVTAAWLVLVHWFHMHRAPGQGPTGRGFQLRDGSGIGKNISGRIGYGSGTGIFII